VVSSQRPRSCSQWYMARCIYKFMSSVPCGVPCGRPVVFFQIVGKCVCVLPSKNVKAILCSDGPASYHLCVSAIDIAVTCAFNISPAGCFQTLCYHCFYCLSSHWFLCLVMYMHTQRSRDTISSTTLVTFGHSACIIAHVAV
jgi:hypothetical protein